MARIKIVLLLGVPALVSMTPGAWFFIPPQAVQSERLGEVRNKAVCECSGLARSLSRPQALWMHNDSGDEPHLFLTETSGRHVMRVAVRGVQAFDWEDICSFRSREQDWLLIGDVGDNARVRGKGRKAKPALLVLKEPKFTGDRRIKVRAAREIRFEFEDGRFDCEAVAVDPVAETILLVTKTLNPLSCALYQLPLYPDRSTVPVAKRLQRIPIPIVTSMDVTADGRRMVVMTPTLAFVIDRAAGESWQTAVRRKPAAYRLPRLRQAEAICFGANGNTVFTTSEGISQPIWKVTFGVPPRS